MCFSPSCCSVLSTEGKNTSRTHKKPKLSVCFFINPSVIIVPSHRRAYELHDLFLERADDINAPFIDSTNAVCAAIPVREMKINRGSMVEIRHVFNY